MVGYVNIPCTYKDKTSIEEFYFVDTPTATTVLGLETCLLLGLIKLLYAMKSEGPMTKQDLPTKHSDIFEGIGHLSGECHIHLRPDASAVIHPPRKVPLAIRDKLKTDWTQWNNSM